MVGADAPTPIEPKDHWYFLSFYYVCTPYKSNLYIHQTKIIKKRTNNGLKELACTPFDYSLASPLDIGDRDERHGESKLGRWLRTVASRALRRRRRRWQR
jgi:hypothetical protein